jgi:hypothetical protein
MRKKEGKKMGLNARQRGQPFYQSKTKHNTNDTDGVSSGHTDTSFML